jgi:hypothetical protein
MEQTIQEMLAAAEQDLVDKIRQRDELNLKIITIQNQVGSLRSLTARNSLASRFLQAGKPPLVGLTDAIRSVLRLQHKPMSAGKIKTLLDVLGFNFLGISNASAAVHNTLKRLAESGEVIYTPATKTYRIGLWG